MIENTTDDRQAKRCGHNFPIAECPYAFCEAKEIALKLEASERRCERAEKLAADQIFEIGHLERKLEHLPRTDKGMFDECYKRCKEQKARIAELEAQLAAKQPAVSVDWEAMGELLRKEVYACGPIAWREDHIRAAKAVIAAYEASRAGEGKDGD